MENDLRSFARLLKALADPTRLRIVGLLLAGEVCVCNIYETLRIPQSKASRHLAYLRSAGIVSGEKRGLWVYYRLADAKDDVSRSLLSAVQHCLGHVDVLKKDGVRLEKKTGCCVPAPTPLDWACCSTDAPAQPGRK